MKKRQFGTTGFQCSEIGLGTWQLGGDFGSMSHDLALQLLDKAVSSGINFFDTADVYGAGKSEEFIGEYFSGKKGDNYIVTKYGRDGSVYPDNYNRDNLRRCTEASLKRLKVDKLDLLQLHCIPQPELEKGTVFDWLSELKEEGLIAHFGASVETMEEAKICMRHNDLTSLQIIFNIFRQNPVEEIFDDALKKNIGIIVRLPLASGLLAGKYNSTTIFEESDHRNYNADGNFFSVGETFSGIPFDKGLSFVEEVRKVVPETMSMAQFALRWILDHEAVSTVIAGATKIYQIESNAAAAGFPPLEKEIHDKLTELYQTKVKEAIRGRY